ncbi:MAG: 3-oxoacyl-ACP synthase [Acidobacteria bacterium]|nr:MAG: 3-oxoacyl-ACP synthase [Acidobacteriota bacterium]
MTTIESIAYAFPARCLTNQELKQTYPDWDFERLEKRAGVFTRHVAAETETALDLAVRACEQLAQQDRLHADEIDALIFCTQSPDHIMPPNSCILHGALELNPNVLAFDITLACSGYIYGLQLADSLIRSGVAERVLLATADTYTRYIHPGDRATRSLFGDGGAVSIIVESQNARGIRDIRCGTAGTQYKKFIIPAGGMRMPRSASSARETIDHSGNVRTEEHIKMDGLGVLSFFNATVPCSVKETLTQNGLSIDEVDLFVFHQASQVVLDTLRTAMGIPPGKMVYDLAEVGNLVSASIPVALSRAFERGQAKPGQLALLCGFGVGLSWGTALVDL